uniref:Protein kinase domain-containing protein n=1 Tax=Neogobius melanostomus TaxID=47308 RepID=A0A8C6T025_9GOBI
QPSNTEYASRETLLTPNTIISGNFSSYLIKEFKGKGTYARVARCTDLSTKEDVAVKMYRVGMSRAGRHEAYLLRKLPRHSHSKNIVKFITSFHYQDHYCLVLEHLDRSLFDYIEEAQKLTHVGDIRYIAEQVLVALRELERHGLIHADLKPDNVMLVNQQLEPFRVKLIDLGMTMTVRSLVPGVTIQASRYRAPEVFFGTKMNGAVDMWALGCVLVYVYLGENLFPYRCEYQIMRVLTQMFGMPDLLQLNEGLFTQSFFTKQHGEYRLKTLEEYNATQPTKPCSSGLFRCFTCLEDMMEHRPAPQTDEEKQETRQFFYLLRQLFQVNPAKRINALELCAIHSLHIDTNTKYTSCTNVCVEDLHRPEEQYLLYSIINLFNHFGMVLKFFFLQRL